MTDLINLPYWNVLKVQETDLNYVIDATYEIEPAGCPRQPKMNGVSSSPNGKR